MTTDFPDYMAGYPSMPADEFTSNSDYELGWLSGLHKTANKSIAKIYGSYDDFKLNPDDLADLDDLNFDTFKENSSPLIYISIWLVVGIIFAITGLCFCCANKCCCCCRSSFKGRKRSDREDDESTFRPHFSERNDKRYKKSKLSVGAIILTGLMVIWLAAFLLVILYTFAGNKETNKAVENIQGDLNNGFDDADLYIETSIKQLDHLFVNGFKLFNGAINKAVDECEDTSGLDLCGQIESNLDIPIKDTNKQLNDSVKDLSDALKSVQKTIRDAKETVDTDFEDIISESNRGLYWFFMLFNVLYCIIFGLVLIGLILAVAAGSDGLKTGGYLAIRAGIVLMFILVFFVVCQMIIMFTIGGVTTQIFCPALRALEEENQRSNQGAEQFTTEKPEEDYYAVPPYGAIMQACKNDKSAYDAFSLMNAYPVRNLSEVVKQFDGLIPGVPRPKSLMDANMTKSFPNGVLVARNPYDTALEIQVQVKNYVDFIINATEKEVGKCRPAYNAINALVSIFCEKIPAPVTSFWYISQYLPPIFLLMILTALFFERIHF